MNVLTPDEAVALVERRLGRAAQDPLEIAVVLEAWGGVAPQLSLPLAEGVASRLTVGPAPVEPVLVPRPVDRSLAIGDVGFVIGVLVVGFWISSLAREFGLLNVDRAWRIALPVSLGLQWLLRRRYLSGADGLGRLRREPWLLAPVAALVAAMAFVRPGGLLAAGLTTIWVGGFVLTRRGWGHWFGLILVLAAATLAVGVRPAAIVVAVAVIAAVGAVVALRGVTPSMRRSGPWQRAVPAGLVGAGMGLLLVIEPRFSWNAPGALPALTVVPSLLGSLWGGLHMTRLWEVMPRVLATTSVRRRSEGKVGRLTSRLLAESLLRLVVGTVAASAAVMLWVTIDGREVAITRRLLLAHGVLAVAGLAVALLEAFGRWGNALAATLLGVVVALLLHTFVHGTFAPGTRILWGASVCTLAATVPLVRLLREPDRNIAAAL